MLFVHRLMMNCLDRPIYILRHFVDGTVDNDYVKVKHHRLVSFERHYSMEFVENPIDEQMFEELDKSDLLWQLMDRCVLNDHRMRSKHGDNENPLDPSMVNRVFSVHLESMLE